MSMTLAELQLEIDSRRVKEAQKELERLAQSAEKVEGATDSLNRANKDSEDRYRSIAQAAVARQKAMQEEISSMRESNSAVRKMNEGWQERARTYTAVASAERKVQLAQERQEAAMKAAAEAADKNRSSLEKLLSQIDPLEGKLSRLDKMEQQLTQSFRQGIVDMETYSMSLAKIAGQRAQIGDQQMQQVAAGASNAAKQMERLGLHTAQAHADLLSLGRAAASGDIKGASGSILRLSRATGILNVAFAASGISVLALAGGVATLVAAYHQGQAEAQRYNEAIIMTGNYAGVSSNQLAGMAARIAESRGTIREASQALTLLAGSGKLAGENLEKMGATVLAVSKTTGRSVQEVVRDFEEIGRDPVRAVVDLNDKYRVLSVAVYEQSRALVEQGRQQEATSLVEKAYANEMQGRVEQIRKNLGLLEKSWASVRGAASGAWDAMLNVGRESTLQSKVDDLNKQIAAIDRTIESNGSGMRGQGRDYGDLAVQSAKSERSRVVAQRDYYQGLLNVEAWAAGIEAEHTRITSEALSANEQINQRILSVDKQKAKAHAIADTRSLTEQSIRGYENDYSLSDSQRAELIKQAKEKEGLLLKDIEKRFSSKKQADISIYRRHFQAIVDDFRNANSILDSERRAGNISEEEYWQKKISLIDQNEAAQKIAMHGELERLSRTKNSAKQRADIEAQLAKISKEADRDRQLAANGQKEAMHKAEIAITAYIDALNQLVKAEERAGQQRLAGMGLGSRERELQAGLDGADARFAQEQVNLSRDLDSKNINQGEYEKKLAGIRQAHQSLRDQLVANYHAIREAEGNWLLGSQEGLRNYADEAANAYKVAADFSHSFARNMENAIMDLATTSDHSFKSVARSFGNLTASVLRDMARMALQQQVMGPLMGMLSSAFTPTLTMGGAAVSAAPSVDLSHSMGQFSFSSGGFTGVGGRYEPAGVVHKGEGVLNQDEIRALGGEAGFNALRRAIRGPGHSMGGMAGSPMLPPPVGRQAPAGGEPKVEIHIHNNGEVSSEATPGLEEFARLMQQIARAEYQKLQVRSQRPGGIGWNDSQRFV